MFFPKHFPVRKLNLIKRSRKMQLFRTLALMMAALLVVFMVGCGGDDDDDTTEDVVVNFVSANPASGSTIAGNAQISLTFDNAPADVTVNGTPATVAGKTATWAGNLPPGAAALAVSWKGGAGTTLNYTVTAPDTTAPTILASGSSVKNNDKDIDPAPLNTDGITIKFSEPVQKGTAKISAGGADLGWLTDWTADSVKLSPPKGKEAVNETEYTIEIATKDLAGNALAAGKIVFVTKGKQ
jgi:uncharacterized Zn-binding protein involved in type VI secretion